MHDNLRWPYSRSGRGFEQIRVHVCVRVRVQVLLSHEPTVHTQLLLLNEKVTCSPCGPATLIVKKSATSLFTLQSKKFCGKFHFLVIGYLQEHGDDGIMPLAIVISPLARCNYCIILTDYSHRCRNKDHTLNNFCEKISHNSITTLIIPIEAKGLFQPVAQM